MCSYVDDFNNRNLCLTAKLLKQGYIPDKKRNAPLRTVQLSGRSPAIGEFSLYQCKGMPGTVASHFFCNLASKLCQRKLVMNKVGVKFKVTENKRLYNALLLDKFKPLELSQKIKLYPDTYSLQILSLNLSYAIIER